MAEGFRTISLTIWEKMNIKGEGKNGTRRNGRKGRKEGGDGARTTHGACNMMHEYKHTMHMMGMQCKMTIGTNAIW